MERIDFHKDFDFSSKNNDYYCYFNNEKFLVQKIMIITVILIMKN